MIIYMEKSFIEAVRLADAVAPHPRWTVIAGPGCGKTYFEEKYGKQFKIFDTDKVISNFCPSYWEKNVRGNWNEANMESLAWLTRFVMGGSRSFLITNLWGKNFLEILFRNESSGKPYSRKGLLFFYRDSAEDIKEIFESLGKTTETLKTLRSWVDSHKKYAHLTGAKVIELKKGEYLSDFVQPTEDGFKLISSTSRRTTGGVK